jgi:hypothetical protein
MAGILDIRVQKLFVVVLFFKVLSSGLGWYFGFPWSLGFWLPLALMSAYIILGLKRHDSDVTDEKFADTCYYLGFIFTITSIIFSLFDLPNIGTRIQDIAVRFGAAMVSTVLGLAVRVYLVSFKRDVADAIKDAEDAVIDASQKFREQLVIAFEKLRDFQSEVDLASKATVERVNMHVEALSKNHADKLTEFFADLTAKNQEGFTEALAEVRAASVRLANSVDSYSKGMKTNLSSIEERVVAFTDAVTSRLQTTTFPDDYFSKNLEGPLHQLQGAAHDISVSVVRTSTDVTQSASALTGALKKLRDKAGAAEDSLATVLKLTEQQQAVLNTAQGQLTVLEQLNTTLVGFDALFGKTLDGIDTSSKVSSELAGRVAAITTEGAEARKALDRSLADVVVKLGANAQAMEALSTQVGANAHASKQVAAQLADSATTSAAVAGKLAANSAAAALVAVKLDGIATADVEAAKSLGNLGKHAASAIDKVDTAVEQLQGMLRQLTSLDTALRAQSSELRDVAERIKDVRVTVELPAEAAQAAHFGGESAVPLLVDLGRPNGRTNEPELLKAVGTVPALAPSGGNGTGAAPETSSALVSLSVPPSGAVSPALPSVPPASPPSST